MSLERPTEGNKKHKEDVFDSFSCRHLDLVRFDKENTNTIDNIDDLVDSVLARGKVSFCEDHVEDVDKVQLFVKKRSVSRSRSHVEIRTAFGMGNSLSIKKLLAIALSFVLLFAVLASASSFVDPDLDGTTVNPEDMLVEDTLSSNATISDANLTDGTMDNDSFFDNSTFPSDQNGTVTVDNESMMNETGNTIYNDTLIGENGSLNESIPIINNFENDTNETIDNDMFIGENESLNVTNPLDNQTSNITEGEDTSLNNTPQQVGVLDNTSGYDNISINATTNESIDVSTIDDNQSARATYLSITLNTDKNSYLVNETVFISGTVFFNNSFVETTVNLSINSLGNSFLYTINTTNGTFSYEYVASKSGNYIVGAHAIFENETASIDTSFIVNDITDETDNVTVLSLIQGEAVVGESVFWEKKIMVKNNASIQRTLNIATNIPDAVSNIRIQDVSEINEVNYTVLVNQIAEKNISEQISSSTSIMFNRTFDAWDEREFTITYETPAPIKQEISYDGGKRIKIQSNATVHYYNVTAYTELPELNYKPRFYRVINGTRVDVTFDPLYNVTYLDNNSNGKYDGISWNVPRLSNDTYEVIIVITKAVHLDENRGFISDIYDEVYRKDGVWSEPIYHNEYVRVTFEQNLTNRNDITFYARNNQSLDTTVEVYYYDSDEKITEFPIIEQEDFYRVYLTGMEGSHQIFDLKIKNLDNENSTYLEFDYIIDPNNKDAVDSNVTDMDSSADKGTEINFPNAQDISPNSNYMNIQENNTGEAEVDEWLENDADAGTLVDATHVGSSIYLESVDTNNYLQFNKDGGYARWYTFADTTGGTGTYTVNLSVYFLGPWDGDDDCNWYIDTSGDDTAEYSGQFANPTSGWYTADVGSLSQADVNSARLMLEYIKSAGPGAANVDAARLGVYKAASTNYEIDFEYNWSNADYDETNEKVCFYVGSHTGDDNLNVSAWNGSSSSWVHLGDITGTGWTNLTALNLTNSAYVIRLNGTIEMSDTTQDDWNIDLIMLHTWTPPTIPNVITNESTGVEETNATLRGYLQSNGSADTTCGFRYGTTSGSYSQNFSKGVIANQTEFYNDNDSLTQGQIYHYQAWANNSAGFANGTERSFLTKPSSPSSLNAQANSSTMIYLSWPSLGTGANTTYIERNTISSWARGTGTEVYNGTDLNCEDSSGISAGNTYYYQAWGFTNWANATTTLNQWSDAYTSAGPVTTPTIPTVVTNASTGVEETTATIWGFLESNGSADTTCWFLWDTDNDYAYNETQGVKANRSEFSKGLTTLTSGDLYYFNTKANNSAGWDNDGGELTFFTKPPEPDSITTTTINGTNASFSVDPANVGSGATSYTYARYNTGSASTTRAEGSFGFNSTSDTPKITGLSPCTHYYVSAWAWGQEGGIGQYSDTYIITDFWTPCIPVVITNESTGVEETNATLRGYLQSNGSADTTCGFRYGTTSGSYSQNFSKGVIANQTEFYNDNDSLTQGQIYHYQAWANNSAGFANGTERSFLTKPSSPSSLNAQANSSTMIYLSWPSLGTGANTTYIERNASGQTVWARGEGTEIYNDTGTYYEDTGLTVEVTYYYQAWSFANWANATTTLNQWSDAYTSAGPVTTPIIPTVVTNASTGVEETNATLRGFLQNNGSADTTCGFRFGTSPGSYSENFSKGVIANQTEFSNDNDSLTSGDLYYYQAWANNSAGFASGSELKFFTKPPAVTNLAESSSTNTSLTYTWTKATVGSGATAYTMIVLNETGYSNYPNSRTNGTEVYNGTAASNTASSLTPGTHYYFSAFSWGIEDSTGNWNDTYDTMDTWTNPGDPTNPSTTNGSTWINVTFTHGQNGEYTMIRRNASGSATFPADRTSGVEVDNTTNTYANDTGLLAMGVTYYYALWTWDTDGGKWCDYQTNITGTTWNLSINATPSQWNLGNVWVGGSNTSTGFYFNITNEGNATLNIQIKASNATNSTTGARWNLTSTPDHNNFTLHYDKSGDGGWTIINTTYDIFVTNLAIDGYQTFDLKMTHATTSSVLDPMSLTVTFKSVVS